MDKLVSSKSGKSLENEDESNNSRSENNEFQHKEKEDYNFTDMYKYAGKSMASSQQDRINTYLQLQKQKRHSVIDEKRDLSELFPEACENCVEHEEGELMEVDVNRKEKHKFRYRLMMSEWMTEVPEDFSLNWIAKFCPFGHRNLLIASSNETVCYTSYGKMCFKFRSPLPGGGTIIGHKRIFTVLDVIYNTRSNTFYILDVIAWNCMSLKDCEAELRFFWLQSKFEELCALHKVFSKKYTFKLLNPLPAETSLLQEEIFNIPKEENVLQPYDGIIFYHKEGLYEFGHTPLAVWLKPFMFIEKLSIDVPDIYRNKMPKNYVNLEDYLMNKHKYSKNKKYKNNSKEMETEEVPET